ncbi:hypothetical protein [Streptomyces sp. NPDC044948]|uniref:hypothetical protein n=1 Tax=Streptomyces sp. NPDC044948 TaxID=3157092 RepID=UPI00341196E5
MTDKQHEADVARVQQQNSLTDIVREIDERPGGLLNNMMRSAVEAAVEDTPFGSIVRGRTNFENYRLNDMLDLVEQTNPEDLTSSGEALYSARTAIKEAAGELKGHIDIVHWVGESGDAFRKWGRSLVSSTEELSEYAAGAADQISAAAVGLAQVRLAMPPRDQRADPASPKSFPKDEQVTDNKEYTAAVEAEKNRQEAINQLNRLSSYYAVSRERLAGLPVPTFQTMPDVGVPAPEPTGPGRYYTSPTPPSGSAGSAEAGIVPNHHETPSVRPVVGSTPTDDVVFDPSELSGRTPPVDAPVRTTLDNAGPAPVQAGPVTGQTLPPPGHPTDSSGGTGPFANGFNTPASTNRPGRGGGPNGFRSPGFAQGRATSTGDKGGSGPGRSLTQGPLNQTGRTAGGQPVAKGGAAGPRPTPMGQGVSGGTPRTGAPKATAAGGPVTGAGRSSGVVGGRPGAASGGAVRSGPRIPRGTVVGSEAATNSQAAKGRPGQRSGGSASSGQPRITGMPAGRGSASSAARNGMTQGGAGLVRGPGGRGRRRDERDEEGTQRPDYLVEDEETHLPTNQRRDVPPVVN